MPGVRRRHCHIRSHHQQRAHAALITKTIQQLVSGTAGARQRLLRDAPHLRDVGAMIGIIDAAIAGKLVSLLPVLAPALSIALTSKTPVTTITPASLAQREGEI